MFLNIYFLKYNLQKYKNLTNSKKYTNFAASKISLRFFLIKNFTPFQP